MLKALNDRYYDLFGDLYVNRALLPDRQHREMTAALMSEYKRELEEKLGHAALRRANEAFVLKYRLRHELPRGFWIFRNPVARMYRKACKAALAEFVAGLAEKMEARAAELVEKPEPEDPPMPEHTSATIDE